MAADDLPAKLEPAALLADYEQLRADALVGGGQGWRWAQALLARSGLAAWLATWSEHAVAAGMKLKHSEATSTTAAPAAVTDSKSLVSALTLMLLACTGTGSPAGAA